MHSSALKSRLAFSFAVITLSHYTRHVKNNYIVMQSSCYDCLIYLFSAKKQVCLCFLVVNMISWFTMYPAMLKARSAGTDSQVRKVRISCVACTLPMWWAFWWCLFINVSSYFCSSLPSWALSQLVGFHNVINKMRKFSFCFTNTAFFKVVTHLLLP